MRPLTSIIAAATLGTKPETSAFADCRQKIAAAAGCDLTPLSGQLSASFSSFRDGRQGLSQPSIGGIAADAGMPAGNDVETGYGGSSEIARLYQ
jgi:hypothetical protein